MSLARDDAHGASSAWWAFQSNREGGSIYSRRAEKDEDEGKEEREIIITIEVKTDENANPEHLQPGETAQSFRKGGQLIPGELRQMRERDGKEIAGYFNSSSEQDESRL